MIIIHLLFHSIYLYWVSTVLKIRGATVGGEMQNPFTYRDRLYLWEILASKRWIGKYIVFLILKNATEKTKSGWSWEMGTILNMVAGKGSLKRWYLTKIWSRCWMIWWEYEGKSSSKRKQQVQRSWGRNIVWMYLKIIQRERKFRVGGTRGINN